MSLQRSTRATTARPSRGAVTIGARPAAAGPFHIRQHHICRAEAGDTPPPATTPEQQPQQQPAAPAQPATPSAPLLAPGQGTAIVTGAISIIFGIAYLVLVSLLDMRGGELQPPPPEAFMQ